MTGAPSSTAAARACDAATPLIDGEIVGVGEGVSLYGLVFLDHPRPRVGEEVKIVWRMTGEGDLSVAYFAPNSRPRQLTFGPEPHAGSSFDRPGDEWGTGFLFDQPGCWHIHLRRTVGSADAWVDVVS